MNSRRVKTNMYGNPELKVAMKHRRTRSGDTSKNPIGYFTIKGILYKVTFYEDRGSDNDAEYWAAVTELGKAETRSNSGLGS